MQNPKRYTSTYTSINIEMHSVVSLGFVLHSLLGPGILSVLVAQLNKRHVSRTFVCCIGKTDAENHGSYKRSGG